MKTIMVSKEEYQKLKQQAKAYQKLTGQLFRSVLRDPVQEVVEDFRKTNLYEKGFLEDLGNGLRESSYMKTKK